MISTAPVFHNIGTAGRLTADTDVALSANSDQRAPTQKAVKAYVDSATVGLLDDRGSYDASSNLFPTRGGSGNLGAVLKGDVWRVSVAGILGGTAVNIGDWFRALVDSPAQTAGNWSIMPRASTNDYISFDASSNPNYPAATKGTRYKVTVEGKVGGILGKTVRVGDTFEALVDSSGGTEASVGTEFLIRQGYIYGFLEVSSGKKLTVNNSITLSGTDGSTLNISTGGTLGSAAFTSSSAYEVPLTFSTGLTRSVNTITVDSVQNITRLSNLATDGAVFTSGANGTLNSGILSSTFGGTGVNNTGTITNASNTIISGGGTLNLGGFNLTIPATGTVAYRNLTNTFSSNNIFNANGALSISSVLVNGTWLTSGGSSTTTKPQFLIEVNGTTSASWSTNGTGVGVNAPSGFTGNIVDFQSNGVSTFKVSSTETVLTAMSGAYVTVQGHILKGGFSGSTAGRPSIAMGLISGSSIYAKVGGISANDAFCVSSESGTVDVNVFGAFTTNTSRNVVFGAAPKNYDGVYTGAGHTATFSGGAGSSVTTGGAGGNAFITGGVAAGSGNNNGGNVVLSGGAATGSGSAGIVSIASGIVFRLGNTAVASGALVTTHYVTLQDITGQLFRVPVLI